MRVITGIAIASLFMSSMAFAADNCESMAVSKDGKPLTGAAKTASIKKCQSEAAATAPKASAACEEKAVSKDGKPLTGAAKTASIKKCEADAAAAK